MRVISGRFKGMEILTPKNAHTTRPTTDRAKEAIFSHLESIGALDDTAVVDIFAGTGALGFEAISRGARSITFVESDTKISALIAQSARGLGRYESARDIRVQIARTKAENFAQKNVQRFDLIFLDPPYGVSTEGVNSIVRNLVGTSINDDGVFVIERSVRSQAIQAPEGWEFYLTKEYGETIVFYMARVDE